MKKSNIFLALACLFTINICIAQVSDTKKKNTNAALGFMKGMQTCSSIEPKRSFVFDTTPGSRGLIDNYYLWENGQTIYVRFLSGSKALQDRIKTAAKEWEKYANIKFEFVDYGAANIRVLLNDKDGYYSLIGNLANSVSQEKHTMNYDTTGNNFKRPDLFYTTVVHEFGHAIGLLHEHNSPISGIKWNKEFVYTELKRTQNWSKEDVDNNLFRPLGLTYTNGTTYDRYSIMHYPIMKEWTTDGFSVNWNTSISEGDKALIGAMYPKFGNRSKEVPRFNVTGFKGLKIINNTAKQGISMFPTFNLTTAGREGNFLIMALLYDKDGNAIKSTSQTYRVFGVAGVYQSFKLPPGKNYGINTSSQDIEMFIPFAEIPLPAGMNNIQIQFRAYTLDGEELKNLYSAEPVRFSIIK